MFFWKIEPKLLVLLIYDFLSYDNHNTSLNISNLKSSLLSGQLKFTLTQLCLKGKVKVENNYFNVICSTCDSTTLWTTEAVRWNTFSRSLIMLGCMRKSHIKYTKWVLPLSHTATKQENKCFLLKCQCIILISTNFHWKSIA